MILARLEKGIVDPPMSGSRPGSEGSSGERHGFVVTGEAMPSPPLTKGPYDWSC
jgi:hypothetical protein